MRTIQHIAYRFVTDNEWFVLYKPRGAEKTGSGQLYIDFPTSAISASKWRRFFEGAPSARESKVKNGPLWTFDVLSIGVPAPHAPMTARLYQRREASFCLANQNIRGPRIPALLPEYGFPMPERPKRKGAPAGLALCLIRTAEGEVWCGWYDRNKLDRVCKSLQGRELLLPLLDKDNEPGSAGFVTFEPDQLYLREIPGDEGMFAAARGEVSKRRRRPVRLTSVAISGFKSLKDVSLNLGSLNVLIGANGAGKSNFVDFFRLLRAMPDGSLQAFVAGRGGADGFFYMGPKHTPQMSATVGFEGGAFQFRLIPTAAGGMLIGESLRAGAAGGRDRSIVLNKSAPESVLQRASRSDARQVTTDVCGLAEALASISVYHFHDTSLLAPMRRDQSVRDRADLRHDASNIASFLLNLREKHRDSYDLICDTVRMIAPFFDEFVLEPEAKGPKETVRLEWRQKGSDYPFQAYQLSDGTIRFICLATALLQPQPPATIVIDEPELGLHPFAIGLLAGLVQSASKRTQVIISTQSPALLDQFEPQDVIVVNRKEGHSTFERLDEKALSEWLAEYSVAELWQKDVLRGGPTNE